MIKNRLIIVADRGTMKAYRVEKAAGRGARLELVQSLEVPEAHAKYQDRMTDMAGRFPVSDGGSGRHANGVAEKLSIENETDRRLIRQLAQNIASVLIQERPEGWSLAAPSRINSAVLEELPRPFREQLTENVPCDLVHVDPNKLSEHFTWLQRV
jgi:hypothetical protein